MGARGNIDLTLVGRFNDGDLAAFDELVLRHRGKLVRMIVRMTKDKSTAEDIVQEAFVKVYFALPNFRGEAAFFTWLYCIAVNTLKSQKTVAQRLKSTKRAINQSPSQLGWEVDFDTPASILECKQTLTTLLGAINKMEAIFSEPLLMFEINGMSYAEISKLISCPIGTVRSRIARGRALIAAKIPI